MIMQGHSKRNDVGEAFDLTVDFAVSKQSFIWTEAHRRAASQLEFAVNSLTNITLMLGKSGVGKSRLIEEVVEFVMLDQAVAVFTEPRVLDDDVVGAVRQAVMGLANTYSQKVAPIFVIDDAHRLHHNTLTKLIRMSHPPDGGDVVFKLVLVGHPGFEQDIQSIAPGATGPAFELWPLDEKDANAFVDEWLAQHGTTDIFENADQRERMLARAEGVPGALIGALEFHKRKAPTMPPAKAKLCDPVRPVAPAQNTPVKAQPCSAVRFESSRPAKAKPAAAPLVLKTQLNAPGQPCKADPKTDAIPKARVRGKVRRKPVADPKPNVATETAMAPDIRIAARADATSVADPLAKATTSDRALPKSDRLARGEPKRKFRLETAIKRQQMQKQERRKREARAKVDWPEFAPAGAAPTPTLAAATLEVRASEAITAPSASRKTRSNMSRGLSMASLGALIVAATLIAPRVTGLSAPAVAVTLPAEASQNVASVPFIQSVADLPTDASSVLRTAVTLGRTNGRAAAAAYAVAAAKGDPRAAYYLGQIYEAGEGVARNPTMAFLWYSTAAGVIPAAGARADALRQELTASTNEAVALAMTHAQIEATGNGLFLWNVESVIPGTTFTIQFSDENGGLLKTVETSIPASETEVPTNASHVKVAATNAGEVSSTPWFRMYSR